MTGAELIRSVRVILHDTEYNVASDGRVYSDEEISRALLSARTDTIKYLYASFEIIGSRNSFADYTKELAGGGLPPVRPRITMSNLLRSVVFAGNGQAQPVDFWKIECGVTAGGAYVHAEVPLIGDPMATNAFNTQVYARSGHFYGTPCTLYYWALCTVDIANNGTDLSNSTGGMPDGFYNTVKYLACANLVKKERAESEDRYKYLMQIFIRRLQSLK